MSDIGSRPRSTPIPGSETFVADESIPGNAPFSPPTPTEFVQAQTAAPYAPPPGRPELPGMYPTDPEFQFVPLSARRRRRGLGWVLMVILVGIGPAIGIGIGIWAVFKAKDAIDDANDLSDPTLSDADREALGLAPGVQRLFDGDAPSRLAALFEQQLPGEPTRFTRILVYGDYAFATVQDPAQPTHLDQYQWRSAELGAPSPQESVTDVESQLFSVGDINWVAVAQAAAAAGELAGVEDGAISHIAIEHSTFNPDLRAIVRIFVSGDRGSGFIELAPTGEVLAVR